MWKVIIIVEMCHSNFTAISLLVWAPEEVTVAEGCGRLVLSHHQTFSGAVRAGNDTAETYVVLDALRFSASNGINCKKNSQQKKLT